MAKKNRGKVVQMLSPENYIRKKARNLPLYECLVNSSWEEFRMSQVVVSRRHSNGNITAGIYLVDLFCLGVKDSFFMFNISPVEYNEKKKNIFERSNPKTIDYTLVHNIVFAGVEFAEEFGFAPYKDFVSVTRFILEEDNDDMEIIEIECGHDGKPTFMRGPYDDPVKAAKIIAQLERTAGPGNYNIFD